MTGRPLRRGLVLAATALALVLVAGGTAAAAGYTMRPLVSDQPGMAPTTDASLVNPWGIASGPATPWWVSDNETDMATIYTGAGAKIPFAVSVAGKPTGTVFNGGTQFVVPTPSGTAPARFIFATQSGTILGWAGGPAAHQAASVPGAVFTGLAIAGDHLYAANFAGARVDVFEGSFTVVTAPGAFVDPKLPHGYAPFGIQNVGGHIFVAYAKVDPVTGDEKAGRGRGWVDEYDANGALVAHVARRGKLNAPWGITMAPETGFGELSGALIVGNFGDGRMNGFRKDAAGEWQHVDLLRGTDGLALAIEGLWGIGFGNGGNAGPTTSLFFAAGIDDETHGLFGEIRAAS